MPELENVDETRGVERIQLSPADEGPWVVPSLDHGPDTAGPEQGWPPRPKDVTNYRTRPLEETPPVLTPEARARLRDAAARSPRVTAVLSDRAEHVGLAPLAAPKDTRGGDAALRTRHYFFDHAHGRTVQVLMRDDTVVDVEVREGFQPRESPEEVARAIGLAHDDPRLRDAVDGLVGEAILMQAAADDPAGDHRILFVGFYRTVGGPPRHAARVDLSDGRVLSIRDLTR